MLQTKNLPLALFSAFCLKALITGLNYETVACLGVLGGVAFLYEMFIQNKSITKFKEEVAAIKSEDAALKKDLEQIKAYMSSLKLNSINRTPNGLNRSAQQ